METLLKRAYEFLREHPDLNEVELTDTTGIKVRVTRLAPVVCGWSGQPGVWQWIQGTQP